VNLYFGFTVQKELVNHISVICVNLDVENLLAKHNFTFISSGTFSCCLGLYVLGIFVLRKKMNAFCLFENRFIQAALIEHIKGTLF
jgi:hypothetical protein